MRKFVCFILVLVFLFSLLTFVPFSVKENVKASSGRWLQLNLRICGGAVYSIAIDPLNQNTIYAGSLWGDGVIKSTDGGNNWIKTDLQDEDVYCIIVDPIDSKIIYVGTTKGVYKSPDSGLNWKQINIGFTKAEEIDGLAIDPIKRNTIYAVTYGSGVYRSTNGGETWNKTNLNITNATSIIIDPINTDILYVGTEDGHVFRSMNGGINWIVNYIVDAYIFCLAIDPISMNTIYSGTNNGIYKSTDGSLSWGELNTGLPKTDTRIFSIVIDGTNTSILYAGTYDGGVYKSTDGGLSWFPTALLGAQVLSLAIDPVNTNTIYAGTWGLGIFKSTTVGESWNSVNNGLSSSSINTILINPYNADIIYVGTELGIFKSTNEGLSWNKINKGLSGTDIKTIAFDSSNTNILYAGSRGDGISKTTDGGLNWTSENKGLSGGYINSLAIDPKNTNIVYAGVYGKGIFKSTDGGLTWNATGLKSIIFYESIAIDPINTDIIYVGTSEGIFKSVNGGWSWNQINKGLKGSYVSCIIVDQNNPNTLYVSLKNLYWGENGALLESGGVYKSMNGGASWDQTALTNANVNTIVLDPTNPKIIYAGINEGIFKSVNGGESWDSINDGLKYLTITSIAINPGNSQVIYSATYGGLFKYSQQYVIQSLVGFGGSISNLGFLFVDPGSNQTYFITPNPGFKIKEVKVDGLLVGAVSTYTFNDITSDHIIEASFEKEITQTVIILQIGNTTFTVNGKSRTLDSPPIIKNSRTLVPIRAVIEALGGTVGWDSNEKKVTVTLENTTLELWIGKSTAKVNGVDTPIDSTNSKVVPEIINGRTMLPLRFVTENLGCSLVWNQSTQTITITYLSTNFKLNSNPNVIKYINPKTYKVTYTLNISFIDEINVDRLDVFTPSPRNWSSQTNAVLLDCVPKTTCVVKYDPLYGNKYIYYDKTSLINNSLSVTQEFQFTCYEISTCFENIKDIYEYDKNSAEFELYTRDEPEIETNYFKDIVKSVIGDEKNPVEICRKIYNFVINYMTYGDIHQPGGAKNVYINKKGDCGGYSTLFVALTRAAGIPARVVVGGWSSSTTDKYNNWHLWAEFYLEKIGWIPVDPTMGASNDKNRSYYFGNLDNNRYIASKGLNIPLGEYNPVLFQTCCWWWWGNWTKFEEPKTLLNLKFEEVKP